jgi:alkylation response protein AidB-like acyl-CoA dehydrogenase
LASTIEESVVPLMPLARLHVSPQESSEVWASLEEIGIFGITVPESQGGSGLGAVEEALIALTLGRCLAAPAVFATMGAAHAVPFGGTLKGKRIAAGYRRAGRVVAVENSGCEFVLAREADRAAVHATGSQRPRPLDQTLWLASLQEYPSLGEPVARLDAAGLLRLRLIDAAALAGIAQAALDMAVAYAGIREQFGRPIGSFQAVKHHCANMAIASNCARDQTAFAAVAIDDQRDDAAMQVESALLVAGKAALDNAGKNIQIHGGIGFSDEADPHLLLKRAQLLIAIAGGLEATNQRVANAKAGW